MKAFKKEYITFIVKDRATWDIKDFRFEWDESIWNDIKRKCRTANPFIRKQEIPPDELCDFNECGNDRNGCPFYEYCLPSIEIINEGYEQVRDDDIWDKITKFIYIRSLLKEKDEISDYLKNRFSKDGKAINAYISAETEDETCPIYQIEWSERNGKKGKTFAMNVGELE